MDRKLTSFAQLKYALKKKQTRRDRIVGIDSSRDDVTEAQALLHGEETVAFGDAGYPGVEKRPEGQGSEVEWPVAMKPGKRKAL